MTTDDNTSTMSVGANDVSTPVSSRPHIDTSSSSVPPFPGNRGSQQAVHPNPTSRTKTTKHITSRPSLSSRIPSAARVHRYALATKGGAEKQTGSNHRRTASDNQEPTVKESKSSRCNTGFGPSTAGATNHNIPDLDQMENDLTATISRKSLSQTNLPKQSNKSQADIARRKNKSSEKLRRNLSGTGLGRAAMLAREGESKPASRAQVHFALGNDGDAEDKSEGGSEDEDEWVDASGSASPYLSRNASIKSDRSDHGLLGLNPKHKAVPGSSERAGVSPDKGLEPAAYMMAQDLPVIGHNQLLTSKLLQRTPAGQNAVPPKISTFMASASSSRPASTFAPSPVPHQTSISATPETPSSNPSVLPDNQKEGLTSRFVTIDSAGIISDGSYYNPNIVAPTSQPNERSNRRAPAVSLSSGDRKSLARDAQSEDEDGRALGPKPTRRLQSAGTGDNYRTQMKLELQRASAVIEPGQTPAVGSGSGSSLIGFLGPGFDNCIRTDHRMAKLLERSGMEYLVVRRYQNPVDRSFRRIAQLDLSQKIKHGTVVGRQAETGANGQPLTMTGWARQHDHAFGTSHVRNGSLPEHSERRPAMKRPGLPRAVSTMEVVDYDTGRPGERFAVGDVSEQVEDGVLEVGEDQTTLLLRRLWDQPVALGIGQ